MIYDLIQFDTDSSYQEINESSIRSTNLESANVGQSVKLIGSHSSSAAIWESLISSYAHTDISLKKSGYSTSNFNGLALEHQNINVYLAEKLQMLVSNKNKESAFICPSLNKIDGKMDLHDDLISLVGIQKHLCQLDTYQSCVNQKFNFLRLSDINRDISLVEVILRDAETVYFDLDTIKIGELAHNNAGSICGLTITEACQTMKYIGSLSNLKNLQLYSIDYSIAKDERYYECISLLIWYFLEGLTLQSNTSNDETNKKEYIVYPENQELPLFFYNEFDTQKWWCKTNHESDPIACSPNDYEFAKSGVYTERVMKILESTN